MRRGYGEVSAQLGNTLDGSNEVSFQLQEKRFLKKVLIMF